MEITKLSELGMTDCLPTREPRVLGEWALMTFEEFVRWSPENVTAEWVDGAGIVYDELRTTRHAEWVTFLLVVFSDYLERRDAGRVFIQTALTFLPGRPSARMPDLMVILEEHRDDYWVDGPPDLVVEIVDDESAVRDEGDKLKEYEAEGVREYLLVHLRDGRTGLRFLRLDERGRYQPVEPDHVGRFHSAVLPGVWLEASWIGLERPPRERSIAQEMFPNAD